MGPNQASPDSHPDPARRRWMAVLARATAAELGALVRAAGPPAYTVLRGPEGGLVMVRGRAGGGGAPFNLGEMTVTRCTVRTDAGQVGHAYVAGRDGTVAELAALVDAMMQDADRSPALDAQIIAPLEARQKARQAERAGKAEATSVQFFAMQTMRT
ncbi:MAG TPA: phosphonate C-P lyase system protein PhnG [Rhodopila sp.]|uniref:phosphonate C-P lyase system protein PhnG n=1 Tax=Rhodopila sp. TaxID=2480087 RepID=UPI002C4A4CF6|nr:phosphonate C-P lyase system protein PhnG [Rhodopila sp.]HVY16840.1 phosphonate C-P lyase system protein PhnG [Rhodopila sp.]